MNILRIVLLLIFLNGLTNLFASHIPGGNITYECTGNLNEYVVTLEMYVSCPFTLPVQQTLIASNDCALINPAVTLPQIGSAQEIASVCPAQQSQSACYGGTIPGINIYTYQSIVTLSGPCDSWTFKFDQCCRNSATNLTGGTSNNMYFSTVLNSQTASCDNSPYITTPPSPFICIGMSESYCPGAIDPDGDSLYYQLVNPYGASAIPISHNLPYTPLAPLQNFTFDSLTGCITFNQPTIGNFVVTYLIETYDTAGNMTGSIIHDFQFQAISCSNTAPIPNPPGITITSGTATQLGPDLLEMCDGETTCFDVTFTDIDALDTLSIDTALSSIFSTLPGAIITTSGANPFVVNVCWTVPLSMPSQLTATLTINDGACPVMATTSQNINFNIIMNTVASPDVIICGNQAAQLTASGGSVFTWSTISGDPINVGINFSCNPCSNPIASPLFTTTYMVTSNLIGGCDSTDTVIVTFVPDYSISTIGDTLLCDSMSRSMEVNIVPSGSYNINWSPGITLDDSTITTPVASPLKTTDYIVTVVSALGCTKIDTVSIELNPLPGPILLPGDKSICQGESIQFEALLPTHLEDFDGGYDPSLWSSVQGYSVTPTACGAISGDALHFDGLTLRELISNTMDVVNCNSIDFCLLIGNDGSGPAPCENADTLEDIILSYSIVGPSGPWIPIQTFYTEHWDTGGPYENAWECFSVLIPVAAQTTNTYFKWAQPVFSFCMGCDNWALDNINLNCTGTPDYNYSWSPGGELTDSTINNPIATPTSTASYNFTLTDTNGCTMERIQTITVAPNYMIDLTPNDTTICIGDSINFNVIPNAAGVYSYLWTPGGIMTDSIISNPIETFNSTGTIQFTVSVDNGGCVQIDTVNITVSTCVGIDDVGELYDIGIYPNPNNGLFTLTKPIDLNENLEIQLFSAAGKLILVKFLEKNESSIQIDLTKQSKGLYLLHLKIGKNTFARKILKD